MYFSIQFSIFVLFSMRFLSISFDFLVDSMGIFDSIFDLTPSSFHSIPFPFDFHSIRVISKGYPIIQPLPSNCHGKKTLPLRPFLLRRLSWKIKPDPPAPSPSRKSHR